MLLNMLLTVRLHRRIKLSFAIALLTILVNRQNAIAGDLLFQLTSPVYQDVVVIGEVVSTGKDETGQNELVFEPERVLLGDRIPSTITITDYEINPVEPLKEGDSAVLSLVRAGGQRRYKLAHAAFKVSSPNPAKAKILSGPLLGGEQVAYNWFINSCGAEKDFAFSYSGEVDIAFVRREGNLVAITQRSGDRQDSVWITTAESPACKVEPTSWWRALVERLTQCAKE